MAMFVYSKSSSTSWDEETLASSAISLISKYSKNDLQRIFKIVPEAQIPPAYGQD